MKLSEAFNYEATQKDLDKVYKRYLILGTICEVLFIVLLILTVLSTRHNAIRYGIATAVCAWGWVYSSIRSTRAFTARSCAQLFSGIDVPDDYNPTEYLTK